VLLLAAELSRPAIACRLKLLDELDPVARAANEGAVPRAGPAPPEPTVRNFALFVLQV
jgi:hypothetical protein